MTGSRVLRDRLRRSTAAMVVLFYALLAVVGPSLVLCQEADGGVTIEWRGSGCCTPTVPAEGGDEGVGAADPGGRDSGDEDCAGCLDEAAASLVTSRGARCALPPLVPAPADLFAGLTATLAAAARAFDAPARAAPIPPPRLAHLRTVVLRV